MEVDDQEVPAGLHNRMTALEVSVDELRHHNQRFEQYFQEVQATTCSQSNQIEMLHHQLEKQGKDVEHLRNDLRSQVVGLQEGQSALQENMGKGFAHIEALREKRSRSS